MIKFLKRLFSCDHIWRYAGNPTCATFIPSWPFWCEKCKKTINWAPQGKFPDKESYLFYRDKLGVDFKRYWTYFIDASLVGNYFVGELFIVPRYNKE